jgi:hypothetical protein
MSFGFQTKNESGFVTVDANYRNLVLREKISGTFSPVYEQIGYMAIYIDRKQVSINNATNPICFLYSTARAGFVEINITGSTYTWTISSNIAGDYTAYIFDVPTTVGYGHGIKVYDEAASLVFDSENKYMKVIDFFELPTPVGNTPLAHTRTYNQSGTYAVGITNPNSFLILRFNTLFLSSVTCSPNSITITDNGLFDNGYVVDGMGVLSMQKPVPYMVIDVTGY